MRALVVNCSAPLYNLGAAKLTEYRPRVDEAPPFRSILGSSITVSLARSHEWYRPQSEQAHQTRTSDAAAAGEPNALEVF
jgi:hypothetical protein